MNITNTRRLLFEAARLLSDEEAGGHGDRWGVFEEDVERFIGKWIPVALAQGEVVSLGTPSDIGQDRLVAAGEPKAAGLLFSDRPEDRGRAGMLALIALNVQDEATGKAHNILYSAYPFFAEGVLVEANVAEIGLFPNRLEARLELSPENEVPLILFDTLFWKHRGLYRTGETRPFSVAALAYSMAPAQDREFVIDDPEQIRRFRARDAWVKAHGMWSKEDEAASLAAWHPESPEDLEPIRISTGAMAAYLPHSAGPADDAFYQGEVVKVTPSVHVLFGILFWRVDVVVLRPGDNDFVLPFYVVESLFPEGWVPKPGDYVSGTAWVQGYLRAEDKWAEQAPHGG